MASARTHLSPLLIGRDDVLQLAGRRVDEVIESRGQFLLLAGEAGIGKTRLAGAIGAMAEGRGLAHAAAGLAPQDQEVPGALFLDLARTMVRIEGLASLGRGILALTELALDAESTERRLLVARIVDLVADTTASPLVLWFDDLQWADELSLEILADLARRIRDRPILLVAAYRVEEVGPRALLRDWRSRLITQRFAEESRLPRLTRDQTATVTTLIAGSSLPAPRDVVDAVFERTDGVPLHIEELLGALEPEAIVDGRAIREAAVPQTLEDATLQRIGRLSLEAQRVAGAGAVIGRSFVPDVLARVMDVPVEAIEGALQELVEHRVLEAPGLRDQYDFRHQLLRDAIYRNLPQAVRRRLHARAAEFGAQLEGASEIHASFHFEQAGLRDQAFRTALSGARAAARISAHREAFDLFERAIRNLPDGLPPVDRARLCEDFGMEAAAIDANEQAVEWLAKARTLYLEGGEALAAAEIIVPLTSIRHLLGYGLQHAEPNVEAALREIELLPESTGRRRVQARLMVALATSFGHAVRVEEADRIARDALALAREIGDPKAEVEALCILAMTTPFLNREEGFSFGLEAIERARQAGLDLEAARGYRWLGSTYSEIFEAEAAERLLREGIAHAEHSELANHRNYMTAHLALVMWQTGRWDEAMALAERALADGRGGLTTRIAGLYVSGFVHVGRGAFDDAADRLAESLALAERFGELLRLSAPIWGLTELALLRGQPRRAIELAERGAAESAKVGDVAMLVPFIVSGVRARLAAGDPVGAAAWRETVAEAIRRRPLQAGQHALDHADGLLELSRGAPGKAGSLLRAAIAGWDDRRRVWEGTWARLDLATSLHRANRRAEATAMAAEAASAGNRLGSEPIVARAADLQHTIRGGGAADEPWRPLSVREYEIAQLIARGYTNAEIAAELTLSPKTASSHVEHILAKLGLSRRSEIAAWVTLVAVPAPDPRVARTR
jgi:DNA-binding CsgD family transcriptional regulator/tetratricopeptide (TPR) repeat protein